MTLSSCRSSRCYQSGGLSWNPVMLGWGWPLECETSLQARSASHCLSVQHIKKLLFSCQKSSHCLQLAYWSCWQLPTGSCFSPGKPREPCWNGFHLAVWVRWSRQLMYLLMLCFLFYWPVSSLRAKTCYIFIQRSNHWAPASCFEFVFLALHTRDGSWAMLTCC